MIRNVRDALQPVKILTYATYATIEGGVFGAKTPHDTHVCDVWYDGDAGVWAKTLSKTDICTNVIPISLPFFEIYYLHFYTYQVVHLL